MSIMYTGDCSMLSYPQPWFIGFSRYMYWSIYRECEMLHAFCLSTCSSVDIHILVRQHQLTICRVQVAVYLAEFVEAGFEDPYCPFSPGGLVSLGDWLPWLRHVGLGLSVSYPRWGNTVDIANVLCVALSARTIRL